MQYNVTTNVHSEFSFTRSFQVRFSGFFFASDHISC